MTSFFILTRLLVLSSNQGSILAIFLRILQIKYNAKSLKVQRMKSKIKNGINSSENIQSLVEDQSWDSGSKVRCAYPTTKDFYKMPEKAKNFKKMLTWCFKIEF